MSSKFNKSVGGTRGPAGPAGSTGAPGANGLSLDVFLYKFSSAVTGTPAAGFLRLDSATAPTRLVIATVDASARDQTVLLQTALGSSGSKIRVQLRTNVGSWIEVTSAGAGVAVVGAIEWPVTSLVVGPAGAPLNGGEVFALGSSDTSALSAAVTVLQQKTVALTTNGRFGTAPEPENSNAVDLGSSTYRWKDMYMLGTLRCNGTGLAVDRITNGSEMSGLNLLPGGPDCKIQLSGTDYTGNADRAVTLATDGTLQKSGATISAAGVVTGNFRGSEYLDTQGVNGLFFPLGPTAGIQFQNNVYKGLADRVCSHDADGTLKGTTATVSAAGVASFPVVRTGVVNAPTQTVGLLIDDSPSGAIRLTGTNYSGAGKVGQYLQISDSNGTLVSSVVGASGALAVNNWFQPAVGAVSAGASSVANTIYLSPFRVDQTVTINALGARVTTSGVNAQFQLAVYASSATTGLPTGLPLTTSPSLSGTAAGVFSGVVPDFTLTAGKVYWSAFNCDVAIVMQHLTGASSYFASITGSSNLSDIASSATLSSFTRQTPSTYNTWPDLTSVTTTINTGSGTLRGALVYFKVSTL